MSDHQQSPYPPSSTRVRFGVTYVKDGERLVMPPLQGRHFHDTREPAEEWLRAALDDHDNTERLKTIFGAETIPTFRVDAILCWKHGDPVGDRGGAILSHLSPHPPDTRRKHTR